MREEEEEEEGGEEEEEGEGEEEFLGSCLIIYFESLSLFFLSCYNFYIIIIMISYYTHICIIFSHTITPGFLGSSSSSRYSSLNQSIVVVVVDCHPILNNFCAFKQWS